MKTIKKIISGIALGAKLITSPINAQETEAIKDTLVSFGYNAAQASLQYPNQYKFRMYNDATINLSKKLELNIKTMNQTEPGYTSGWETSTINKKYFPIAPLYVMRTEGKDFKSFKPIAHGAGARLNLDDYLPFGMQGYLDVVGWVDKQSDWVGKGELFCYIGTENIGLLTVYRPKGNNFTELEINSKAISTKIGDFSLMGRIESINFDKEKTNAMIGIQYKP